MCKIKLKPDFGSFCFHVFFSVTWQCRRLAVLLLWLGSKCGSLPEQDVIALACSQVGGASACQMVDEWRVPRSSDAVESSRTLPPLKWARPPTSSKTVAPQFSVMENQPL